MLPQSTGMLDLGRFGAGARQQKPAMRDFSIMNKKRKPIPRLGSPAEEPRFWESRGSADYADWGRAKRVSLPDFRMSGTAPRRSQGLFDGSQAAAGKRDAPCQALVEIGPAERDDAE